MLVLLAGMATIGIPDGPTDSESLPSVRVKIADYFSMANRLASFEYDFGDGRVNEIRLEKKLPKNEGVDYPMCIAGKRPDPPAAPGDLEADRISSATRSTTNTRG